MTDPQPTPQEFPTYRVQEFLPSFLLGWGLGTLVTFAVRALADALLTTPCEGRTLLALIVPLLLGPGGLAFTAVNWRRAGRAALGLGLVVASLLPALFVGARDIAVLRGSGCAGGYVVLAPAGGDSISSVTLRVGESRELTGRIGGFTAQDYPGEFTLSGQGSAAGIVVTLPKTTARAGEVFPLTITVQPGTGINTYTAGVQGRVVRDGRTISADGTLEVNVRPAEVK
ncbi:hypothetical protein [Deinococcus radiopugnans]|uniref:Uncharacterized protein n=1 Tax=Deinococcus radiopugnans ATCC 19172 TaxID=585398 RepID=A0A5C4Y3G1_9DEIO|nr:hypothetical protein [Deinococcus radiopugnans]MBB6017617.1 hypothetical protein [Deinococcus radiopugnans ATCC 19172]TNM70376.1 hypothetical protein FHR04_13330 [Deinococcus radiopugnans ATCC 19172]